MSEGDGEGNDGREKLGNENDGKDIDGNDRDRAVGSEATGELVIDAGRGDDSRVDDVKAKDDV